MVNVSEIIDALDELYKALDNAYWAASNVDDKDYISNIQLMVYYEITELTRVLIEDRTAQYRSVSDRMKKVLGSLAVLKADIERIVKVFTVAGKLLAAVEKVVKLVP